jgi:hypothetical protein
MIAMLCRNRVIDYTRWKAVFDSHAADHQAAGLHLLHLWRDLGDANQVFFVFAVDDLALARSFIDQPASAEAGQAAGVLDGEFHFLEGDSAD